MAKVKSKTVTQFSDTVTNELIAEVSKESVVESDAIGTALFGDSVDSEIVSDEPAMDVLTDEIVADLTEPGWVMSVVEEELKRHDEFLSRNYDGEPDVIPSELEIFVHWLRILSESSPLKSKINRLLEEIEQSFQY